MGVTDLRSYFTQIIGHNSVNVHRIPTKVGTEIRRNEPFKCAKVQPDWSTHSCFMADFAKCAKRRRKKTSSILLFELTCPLDSAHHLEQARSRKQNKAEYHQILSELDRLNVTNFYETLEISVLGHFQQFSVTNTYNVLHFIDKDINITRSLVRWMLDDASKVCMTASQRIFMARDCREWL